MGINEQRKGDMVKKGTFLALIVVLAAPAISFGQDPPPASAPAVPRAQEAPVPAPAPPDVQSSPPAVQTPPAVETSPAVQTSAPAGNSVERRRAVRMMEAVLSRAVLGGAEQLAEQLGSGNPDMSFFTGQARARGFILDGYGLFFHVEIPEMQSSLVMSVSALERDLAVANTLDSLRRAVDGVPDGAPKLEIEQMVKRLQVQVGPIQQLADPTTAAARGVMRATDTPTTVTQTITPVPLPVLRDPRAVYREAIKAALIDAMLEYSRGMNIQPDEWLSVAAHRGESLLAPNEIETSPTLVLRIKGSDLAIYDADRARKDEMRKRVEVREF